MKNDLTHAGVARLAILILLHALYVSFAIEPVLTAVFGVFDFFGAETFGKLCTGIVCAGIPILIGFFFTDRGIWWLISLPVQFAVDVGLMYISGSNLYDGTLDDCIGYVLGLILLQAAGVGIKLLWLKWKTRKRVNQ